MPFGLRRGNAVPVYFVNAAGGAFIGSLIFTPLAVYYVTTVGLDPLQLVLLARYSRAASSCSRSPPAWSPTCTAVACRS